MATPGGGEKKVSGICSCYMINVIPGSKLYRYDVEIIRTDISKSLTKGSDDGIRHINKQICWEVIRSVFNKTKGFGDPHGPIDNDMSYAYDQNAILLTSKPISLPRSTVNVSSQEVPKFVRDMSKESDFRVEITPMATNHEVDLSDYSKFTQMRKSPSVSTVDTTICACMNMILKMDAINRKDFVTVGNSYQFEAQNKTPMGQGLVMKSGLSMGVRIVENYGTPKAALALDIKKSLFYDNRLLSDSVQEVFKKYPQSTPPNSVWMAIQDLYEGNFGPSKNMSFLDVRVVYTKSCRTFMIKSFTQRPISEVVIQNEGMSIPEYYQKKHGIKLKYTDFPGIVPDIKTKDGQQLVFPLELLQVIPNQRVPMQKMTIELQNEVKTANIVRPNERFTRIDQIMKKLHLIHAENTVLKSFGISVDPTSNQVEMTVLKKPEIIMGKAKCYPDDKIRWKTRNLTFVKPVTIKKWAVLCHESFKSDAVHFNTKFLEGAKVKGMKLEGPLLRTFSDEYSLEEWVNNFNFLAEKQAEFVLYLGSKKESDSGSRDGLFNRHDLCKLFETLFDVLSEQVSTETAENCLKPKVDAQGNAIKIRGQMLFDTATMELILSKVNVKNGGLNYKPSVNAKAQQFSLDTNKVLVLAYDVAHPKPASRQERIYMQNRSLLSHDPSCVGIVGNVTSDPHGFCGNYFYQEPRKESLDLEKLKESTKELLAKLKKNRPQHHKPPYVFIIRDGISEGQYLMAYDEEFKAIKQGIAELDHTYKPKFVMIIGTKDHNKRFGKQEGKFANNAEPGTVVNKKYVREDCKEFFMQSHYPLQGTGKFSEYTVLFNEVGISDEALEYFILSLCYEHQIVNGAISMTAPVKQADELAKRASKNYYTLMKVYSELKKLKPDLPALRFPCDDYKALIDLLSYKNSRYGSNRFSA